MKKILIVDDEADIIEILQFVLESNGYECITASDGEIGLNLAREANPDLIILDVMMPKINGYKISRLLKYDNKYKDIPILMITARSQEEDKIIGEETGADEYITKPFNPLELVARVKSQLRRYTKYNKNDKENIIYIDGLEINKEKHKCLLYDKEIELTPLEFDILLYLATSRGKVVSSEELFEKVWKEKYLENNNTVMVHIRRIREKLKEDTKNPKFIKTVWGVGYKIE